MDRIANTFSALEMRDRLLITTIRLVTLPSDAAILIGNHDACERDAMMDKVLHRIKVCEVHRLLTMQYLEMVARMIPILNDVAGAHGQLVDQPSGSKYSKRSLEKVQYRKKLVALLQDPGSLGRSCDHQLINQILTVEEQGKISSFKNLALINDRAGEALREIAGRKGKHSARAKDIWPNARELCALMASELYRYTFGKKEPPGKRNKIAQFWCELLWTMAGADGGHNSPAIESDAQCGVGWGWKGRLSFGIWETHLKAVKVFYAEAADIKFPSGNKVLREQPGALEILRLVTDQPSFDDRAG